MSANTTTAVAKKITLAGKYSKFMVFGSWFVDRLAAAGTIDETATAAARAQICLFDQPEKQNEMFDEFFANLTEHDKAVEEKGIEKGVEKATIGMVKKMIQNPQLSDQYIAEVSGLSLDDVKQMRK